MQSACGRAWPTVGRCRLHQAASYARACAWTGACSDRASRKRTRPHACSGARKAACEYDRVFFYLQFALQCVHNVAEEVTITSTCSYRCQELILNSSKLSSCHVHEKQFLMLAQSCRKRPPVSSAPAVAPAVAPAAAPAVAPAPVSAAVPAAAPALPRAVAAGSAENAPSTAPGAAAPGSPAMGLRDDPMACPSDSLACGAGAAVASAPPSADRVELESSVGSAAGNDADGAARRSGSGMPAGLTGLAVAAGLVRRTGSSGLAYASRPGLGGGSSETSASGGGADGGAASGSSVGRAGASCTGTELCALLGSPAESVGSGDAPAVRPAHMSLLGWALQQASAEMHLNIS